MDKIDLRNEWIIDGKIFKCSKKISYEAAKNLVINYEDLYYDMEEGENL